MNSLMTKIVTVAGLVALFLLVSWISGWDYSACDITCWPRRLEFWR